MEEFLIYFLLNSESNRYYESKVVENATDDDPVLRKALNNYMREEIKTALETEFSDDIDRTITSIIKAKNPSEDHTLRDACIDSIYKEINPGGARIVLSIWDSHS